MSYRNQKSSDGVFNTPRYLFLYLDIFFKFKLDPCSTPDNYLSLPYYYTKDDDGLTKDWNMNTFVNPPYGNQNENLWLDKCFEEYKKHGKTIFILLPSKSESNWYHNIMEFEIVIMPQKRISFIKNGKPKHGNNIGSIILGLIGNTPKDKERKELFIKYNRDAGFKTRSVNFLNWFIFPDLVKLKRKSPL